ncbi:hypothetical protein AOX56_06735 [Aeromonas sobria]|uniref:Uncharacterized protein n=1 Tax=Aeromonas sobria TaxID=646 RepID=A0A2N3IMN5_AERSO|nr:hypothetical protein AOX56_06735 [Aeromonas sobria]
MESAAKPRLRKQLRNEHKAVTMLSGSSWTTLGYPYYPARLPPLNVSLQSAAFYLCGFAGLAHG